MPTEKSEIEPLAAFVHGSLASLHLLGLIYNIRRRNRLDIVAHGLGVLYDLRAMRHHLRKC